MMAFSPEYPKWDQNPKFTPLSETTNIPTPFIWSPLPPGGKTIVNTCSCCLKRISLYFCFEKESDDEMETDQTEEGNQPFVAHVPVPSQKEVGFIIVKLASFSDIENIL